MDIGIAQRSCHARGRVGNAKFWHGTSPASCNSPTDVAKSRAIHDRVVKFDMEKFGSECSFLIPNGKPKQRWLWIRSRNGRDQPVERRYVSLGDSAQVQYSEAIGPAVALSSDGGILAFVGDTLVRIWIKRREVLNPTPIAGTEHAADRLPSGAR